MDGIRLAVLEYLAERRALGEMTHASSRNAQYVLVALAEHFDDDLRSVDRDGLTAFIDGRPWGPRTRRQRVGVVRAFFDWCVDVGRLDRSPMPRRRRIPEPRAMARSLNRTQVAELFRHSPDARMTLVLSLMVQGGLRCCEVAGLEWADVDLARRVLVVVGKGRRERAVYVTDELLEDIEAYIAESPPIDGPVIRAQWNHPGTKGLSASWISRMVALIMREAGVPGTAHALRHTAATDVLEWERPAGEAPVDLRDVQEFLGHARLATTEIYTRRRTSRLRSIAEGRRYKVTGDELEGAA